MKKSELFVCLSVAVVSLTVAAILHRLAPGFGLVFKPLLWPLVVLPFTVRPRYALATSFVVPLLSCVLTGMPTWSVALILAAIASGFTMAVAVIVRVSYHHLRRHD